MKRFLIWVVLVFGAGTALSDPMPDDWAWEWPRTDFSQRVVALSDFTSGGPPRDAIPVIDSPLFVMIGRTNITLDPREPVISVNINGDARAYPLAMLMWHEVVNDTVGGQPIVVTFCALCNAGIVFERRLGGDEAGFGNTGLLRHGNRVLYDRATESWWQQFEGRAIVGHRTGTVLARVPAHLESWQDFRDAHSDGLIMVPDDRHRYAYGANPYPGYDSNASQMPYDGSYDGPGEPMMRVIVIDGQPDAWSFDYIRRHGAVRDGDFEISWHAGQSSALDADLIIEGRDVGTVVVDRLGDGGHRESVPYLAPFAFAYRAFHPDAVIHHP